MNTKWRTIMYIFGVIFRGGGAFDVLTRDTNGVPAIVSAMDHNTFLPGDTV